MTGTEWALAAIDVGAVVVAWITFAGFLHWRSAARDARDRLGETRLHQAEEMRRVLAALVEHYGHEAALVALDAAARAAPAAARPQPVRPSPMISETNG